MVNYTPRLQRSGIILPQAVGVFEDDRMLLSLAGRSFLAEHSGSPETAQMTVEDLAFEVARRADTATWDL